VSDTVAVSLCVCDIRKHPEQIPALVDAFLVGSTTGTIQIMLRRVQAEFKALGQDAARRNRIAKFLRDRWDRGGDFGDTHELLLDFEKFLDEQEAERQRA
jgi:hypothetical protein